MTNNDELERDMERQKFDAWFEAEYKHLESSKYTDAVPHIKYGFWQAWLASRATIQLDIDWPEANDDYWKEGEEGAYARGHEDGKDKTALAVRKALADAGIKVNP